MSPRPDPLRWLIVGGPLAFTATWLVLGAVHDGYSQTGDSLSLLAAYGAPYAGVMTAAFLVQAAATAAAGFRLRRSAALAAAFLALDATATVIVALSRISCDAADAAWCTPVADPPSEVVHVAAATIALVSLSLAPIAYAVRHRRPGPALVGLTMLALLLLFVLLTAAGWTEKVAVTLGISWSAVAAARLSATEPARRRRGPGS